MKNTRIGTGARRMAIGAAIMSIAATAAFADFQLTKSTIDSGGGTVVGETFTLSGTIGQPDATTLTGATYTVRGGFWFGGVEIETCDGDFADENGAGNDGVVDTFDLLAMLAVWGACEDCDPDIADENGPGSDDVVDTFDLLLLLSQWGDC